MDKNTDIHALISEFLQERSIITLFSQAAQRDDYQKSGVVPFLNDGGTYYFYVMKPIATRQELLPPKWQLCKGTRMCRSAAGGQWRDMRSGDKTSDLQAEPLEFTALREGHEELGLLAEQIKRFFDAGPYRFSSAKTGQEKHMWMFAAEVRSKEGFLPASHVAATTADRCWLTVDEFKVVGRDDHLYILEDIQAKLKKL